MLLDSTPSFFPDKGSKASPSEDAAPPAAAAAAPVKRLDNLFFIEELQNISVTESKLTTGGRVS